MRTIVVCLILITGIVAGVVLSTVRDTQTFAAPAQAADPSASLVGQNVEINFRQADDISAPYPHDGQMQLAMKLETIKGTVMAATPVWLELKTESGGAFTHAWVPVSSVAYINDAEPSKITPTTQP